MRKLWGEYGFWVICFSALMLRCAKPNVDGIPLQTYDSSFYLYVFYTGFLVPFSLTLSIATLYYGIARPFRQLRVWSPLFLKWLAWWIVNAILSIVVLSAPVGTVIALCSGAPIAVALCILTLMIYPTVRLVAHVKADVRALRRVSPYA